MVKKQDERPRKEVILEDLTKTLDAQRTSKETIFAAKQKRRVIEHSANLKKAEYKVAVINARGPDQKPLYGSDPKIDAKVEECLNNDEGYQTCLQILQKIDGEIFTAKLDLEYFDGVWKILLTEAALMAVP